MSRRSLKLEESSCLLEVRRVAFDIDCTAVLRGMQTICESVVTADCGCFTTLLLLLLFLSLHKWSGVFLLGYY